MKHASGFVPGQSALLIAMLLVSLFSLTPQTLAATAANTALVQTGYSLPSGIELITAKGTGRTTGHIATLSVRNATDQPVEIPPVLFFIPASSQYQPYVGRITPGQRVPPGSTMNVTVDGYCASVRKPPVPDGEALPPPQSWIVSTGQSGAIMIPPVDGPRASGRAMIPGTDNPLPRAVSVAQEPTVAAPLLFAAITEIERATVELHESGRLQTPFSANRDRERESVIQQTFWIYSAELENEPYTQEEFTERLIVQHEKRTGVPITAAPEKDRKQIEQGANDFWDAFELVGVEAKVISHAQEVNTAGIQLSGTEATAVPDVVAADSDREDGAAEGAPPACGSIKGTVSAVRLGGARISFRQIVVYVDGDCDFCPPRPPHEPVVVEENEKGYQPPFVVVPKGTTLKLVNGYEKEVHSAFEFSPSPVDEKPTHVPPVLAKGESTEITPTKSSSGISTGDYLIDSRIHERSDGIMFVTPNSCYTIADENGNYSIGELYPGTYPLKVYTNPRRTNFAAADVTVEAGKVTVQDFILDREVKAKDSQ